MKRYVRIWLILTARVTQIAFASRLGVFTFSLGKLIRFVFFLSFLLFLLTKTKTLAGYNIWEVVLIFVTFNLVDTISQFFLREVYRFRGYIVSGDFDYILLRPISPLFRSLFGGSDIIDGLTLIPLVIFLGYVISHLQQVTIVGGILYILLLCNALLIAFSFHIFALALGVITTEVDNAIWIFRDISQLGRVPVEVYREPVRWLFTFILPVAAMITIPSHALIGIISLTGIFIACCFSSGLLLLSAIAWKYALRQYTSASS